MKSMITSDKILLKINQDSKKCFDWQKSSPSQELLAIFRNEVKGSTKK